MAECVRQEFPAHAHAVQPVVTISSQGPVFSSLEGGLLVLSSRRPPRHAWKLNIRIIEVHVLGAHRQDACRRVLLMTVCPR
jgi:hypothetical protein